jgi:hypothetical protein
LIGAFSPSGQLSIVSRNRSSIVTPSMEAVTTSGVGFETLCPMSRPPTTVRIPTPGIPASAARSAAEMLKSNAIGWMGLLPPMSTLPGLPRHPSEARQLVKVAVCVATALGTSRPVTVSVPWYSLLA